MVYRIECQDCHHIYIGETHRTMFDRISEHFEDLQNRKEDNPLVKHTLLHHGGVQPDFTCKAIRSYKTSLSCQIGEALAINGADKAKLMNSKSEFGQNSIPRVVIEDHSASMTKSVSPAAI